MDMTLKALHVVNIMGQHQHAAPRIHDVVVQFLAEIFPEIDGVIVKTGAFVIEIVGADDRRVAAGIAATEPALVDDRNIGDAVLAGQIIGRPKTMAAGTDDDYVIFGLRLAVGPLFFPVFIARQGILQKTESIKTRHDRTRRLENLLS